MRRHRRLLAVLAVGALAVVAAALLVAPRRASRTVRPAPAAPAPAALDTAAFELKPGEVLTALLSRAGFKSADIGRIVPALRDAGFNMRGMRPGDSLFVLSRDGAARRLLYQRSYESVYCVDMVSSDCRVSMLIREVRAEPAVITGAIASSLYESLLDLGERPQLVNDFTDIFGWEIDFFSEPQPGDSFAILVERRYAGQNFVGYGAILAARYSGQVGRFTGYRFTGSDSSTGYYNDDGQSLQKTFLKSPLRFSRISSRFGRRFHPIRRVVRQHAGVDYVAGTGTPVECVADGRIVSAGWSGGYGRLVTVGHANGYTTYYGHLSGFGKGVRSGQPVSQGQVVGYVGSTGLSTGPHLHYEVRKFGAATNPLKLDPPRLSPVRLVDKERFRLLRDGLVSRLGPVAPLPPQPAPPR